MTGSFLDTTVIVHIADKIEPGKTNGEKFIKANPPAESPYYALRELLDGHIHYLCDTHNAIQAAENIGEALLALANRNPAEGRKKGARIEAFAAALNDTFIKNPSGPRGDEQKREMLQALALRICGLWSRARKLKNVSYVQPLACFNDGKIAYGDAGELRGPNDSFGCKRSQRCAAAAYLFDDQVALRKMIDALHPNKLDDVAAEKNENKQRRKALKELLDHGPQKFDKRKCRALGDAYFAAMCPPSSAVVTSNTVDHMPLCVALKKIAVAP